MCAIFGSFSLEKCQELAELNSYRGSYSYSLASINFDGSQGYLERGLGSMPSFQIAATQPQDVYWLGHIQAPTSTASNNSIHPAILNSIYLWHNGILKADQVKRLQKHFQTDEAWDTKLLAMRIAERGVPSDIDGSFACVMLSKQIFYIFRNEISPLFIDENLNISSTKFSRSNLISPNIMFELDLRKRKCIQTNLKFKTINNPYYLEEL